MCVFLVLFFCCENQTEMTITGQWFTQINHNSRENAFDNFVSETNTNGNDNVPEIIDISKVRCFVVFCIEFTMNVE